MERLLFGIPGTGSSTNLKLMVWGTLMFHGTGILAFVESNMNFQKYISVLDEHLWPVIVKYFGKKPWYIMVDRCPVHRSRETEDLKLRNKS